jgi:inorganic triphosphatase YgiF
MSGHELELKMQVEPAVLATLKRHPLIARHRRGRAVTAYQRSVYFDTPDHLLYHQGIVLRVRSRGAKRIQTVKHVGERTAGLFRRREWEMQIAGDAPDLVPLLESELGAVFSVSGLAAALRPIFATEVRRTIHTLGTEEWSVELAFDEGSIVPLTGATDHAVPFCEVEIELRDGPAACLYGLARRLQEGQPIRLLTQSKAERGFSLVAGAGIRPRKAVPVALAEDMNAGQAFQQIGRSCIGHLLANQDALTETRHPESIHQMRVALRRFRSAMNVFRSFTATPEASRIKEEIRWLLAGLAPARDADVFLAEIVDDVPARLHGPGLDTLRMHFEKRRNEAYEIALARVRDPRFPALVLAIGAWLDDGDWLTRDAARSGMPATLFARAELDRRHAKLKKAGRHLAKLPPIERHEFRIQVKRARYACEFFQSLFGERRTRKMVGLLAEVQDALGGLNDIAVARVILSEAITGRSDCAEAWTAGLIAGFHEARAERLLPKALASWQQFASTEKFWQD